MAAFSALSLAPDVDVIAFRLGIAYSAPFGHRGPRTPSAALALAFVAAVAARGTPELVDNGQTRLRLWLFCAIVAVSHGLLDTLTAG
jgi:inner membrane protein